MISIRGNYPPNTQPAWNNVINKNSSLSNVKRSMIWDDDGKRKFERDEFIAIGEFNGKAVIYFYGHYACLHAGELIIPSGNAVLSNTPQTFEVRNFEKVYQPDNQCNVDDPFRKYFTGSVILSCNEKGDIICSFWVDTYTAKKEWFMRISANNLLFPIKNTPAKVNNLNTSPYTELANRIAVEYHKGWKFDKLYVPNSISNISVMERDKANNPLRIRVECMFNFYGQRDGWFDILLSNNKPYGIVYSIEKLSCISPLKYQNGQSVSYTSTEVTNMRKLQMTYLINYLIPIQRARDSGRDCLSPDRYTYYEPYEYSEPYMDPLTGRQWMVKKQSSRPSGTVPGFRNDCSTEYIIKGINRTLEENSVTIVDVSIKIRPGQIIQAVPIQSRVNYTALLDFSKASPDIYYN